MLPLSSTLNWMMRAAEEPIARHPANLPETLDFREHAEIFLSTYHRAPAGTELGFPLALREGRLCFPMEIASQARYQPFMEGGQFVGTFHVHPADRPAFFDPGDLANTLRSDNPGFIELLLARDRLYALVRANPYLYISAHHVNRNPLLLQEPHAQLLNRRVPEGEERQDESARYRRAGLYWFQRYQLALYEGDPQNPLKRTLTPEGRW